MSRRERFAWIVAVCLASVMSSLDPGLPDVARAAPAVRERAGSPLPPEDAPERRASALLLLDRDGPLDGEEIAADYLLRWRSPARLLRTSRERILIDMGDALGIVRASNQPIAPWVADKAVGASWQWAGASTVSRRHRAHLIIEVRSPRGDAVTNARRLTRLVGTVIASHRPLGVLWTDAGMLVEPNRFLADSEASGRDGNHTTLWLNFLPAALSPHMPVVHTVGLSPLGFRELVLFGREAGPDRALARLVDIADHVLRDRLVLRRGDTLRIGTQETLVVEEIPAPWNSAEVALQLRTGSGTKTPRAKTPRAKRR
jgi:hypothetical protein